MNDLQVFIAVLAAVVLFIHALQGLSQELQQLGRERLRAWLQNLTRHRWQGLATGAVATALVQSSSAVTAMTVALVDAGMISLRGSLAIMLGANVGTTVTAWLVSFKLTGIGPLFVVLGTLLSLLPLRIRVVGKSVFYFGFIFFTLDLIAGALEPLRNDPRMTDWLELARQPLLGVAAGIVVTALLQSSSVVTGLAILLVQQGTLDMHGAVAIVIGANVGTTATALLASLPMSLSARRAALGNLLFNTTGVVLMLPFVTLLANTVGGLTQTPAMAVALAHLLFNIGIALLFLPLLGPVTRLLAGWTPLRAGAPATAAADNDARGTDTP
jgi:Na/Pi-cotransporter